MPIDPSIPQCRHIKVNGLRCGSPSLKGRKFCYFHYEVTRPLIRTDIPVLEDAGAVQYSLNRLAEYILEKRIDYKQASLLLWLMQIASSNVRNARLEPFLKEDIIRDHPEDSYFPNSAPPADEITDSVSEDSEPLAEDSMPEDSMPEDSDPLAEDSEPLAEDGASLADGDEPAAADSLAEVEEPVADAEPPAETLSPLSEGHGFNRAVPHNQGRALAPEVTRNSKPETRNSLRKRPTRQELDEAPVPARAQQELDEIAVRAIEKFRNTPPIEEVAPANKRRRK